MRAAVWTGPHRIDVRDVDAPVAGPGQVLVRVAYCGFCGTDAAIIAGRFAAGAPPRIIGHEVSGTVAALGPGVHGLAVGKAVACDPFDPCRTCPECLAHRMNHCVNRFTSTSGMAEFALYRPSQLHPVPADVPLSRAALTEPLANAVYGLDRAAVRAGQRVVIFGGGAIGQLTALLAARAGAADVVVVEPDERKRRLAVELGATDAAHPDEFAHRGFDVAIEASGSPTAFQAAFQSVGNRGRLVVVALHDPEQALPIDLFSLGRRELTVTGTWSTTGTFDRAVGLLAVLDLDPLITGIVGLDAVADVYATRDAAGRIRTLVRP